MASSTAEELSQESDAFKGSYFTHHLVTALRGAGDTDGDGRVSLDEAYRYAYRRTLASTARTKVGEQHVTLETDLAGQGEIPVTFPAEASAKLDLPAPARSARPRAAACERRRDGRRAEGARRPGAAGPRRWQLRRGRRAEERDRRVPRRRDRRRHHGDRSAHLRCGRCGPDSREGCLRRRGRDRRRADAARWTPMRAEATARSISGRSSSPRASPSSERTRTRVASTSSGTRRARSTFLPCA